MKKFAVILIFCAAALCGQPLTGISGALEWDKMEINAVVSLDLASADIRLPTGRTRGEALLESGYIRLIRPEILDLPVDSSSTIADLVERGEYSIAEAENFALGAKAPVPVLSPDLRSLRASYSLSLGGLVSALLRHSRPAEPMRILGPLPVPAYTGIIIIAAGELPVHGRKGSAMIRPCLFPKIWDTGMNLVYERNMLEPSKDSMIRYAPLSAVLGSGLSAGDAALAGGRPLRILARGVFGERPTDPVIDREDALLIISSAENRRLLREGRVLVALDDSALKVPLEGE
ncbi:MAG: polymerase [Treponema sp.]|jgi:hypothetical protein|nr:polymerase [Treponema sp.]